jgi:hypothetical protein
MMQSIQPIADIQLFDLVLDPFAYADALSEAAHEGRLEGEASERLAHVLELAIAQLDSVGDEYGALALADLFNGLLRLEPVA